MCSCSLQFCICEKLRQAESINALKVTHKVSTFQGSTRGVFPCDFSKSGGSKAKWLAFTNPLYRNVPRKVPSLLFFQMVSGIGSA